MQRVARPASVKFIECIRNELTLKQHTDRERQGKRGVESDSTGIKLIKTIQSPVTKRVFNSTEF